MDSNLPSNERLELSWRTFLMNRGAMSESYYEVARIAFVAAWHAGESESTTRLTQAEAQNERLQTELQSAEQALRHAGPVTRNLVADRVARALSGDSPAAPEVRRHPYPYCDCHYCLRVKKHPQLKPHHARCGCSECASSVVETKAHPDLTAELRDLIFEQKQNCSCPYGDCSTCTRAEAFLAHSSPVETKANYVCDCSKEQAARCIDVNNRTGSPPDDCRRKGVLNGKGNGQ